MIVDLHRSKFINHSYDLFLTTVILLTMKNMIHLSSKIINVPNNAELAIIGAIRIISREKPYLELGLGLDYSR